MHFIVTKLMSFFPAGFDFVSVFRFLLIVAVGSLMLSVFGKMVFGKRSALNHSVSSAIGILFIYIITVIIYTLNPGGLARFLFPLPFVSFHADCLKVFIFADADFPAICTHIVNMIILALLANCFDSFIPKGKGIFSWYFFRFVTVACAMVSQILISFLLNAFLPDAVNRYAPMILLSILVIMILLSLLKVVLSLILTAVNPLLGAVYAFFVSSVFGKMLSKSIVTTGILSVLVLVLNYLEFTTLCIATTAPSLYLIMVAALLVLWYLLGHLL